MKYQKRYKPKTKFEKFLKVYFIIGILVIVLTGVYAGVKSMQRKKEATSERLVSPTDKRLKQQSDFPDIQAPLNLPTVD